MKYIISKVIRKLILIAAMFSMGLTPIYGYAGDMTHYGMENHILVQSPVVGAILKSLGDNQFCILSTIGNSDLVPSIFKQADKSHEKGITDIIDAFFSIGVPLCTPQEATMQEEVQHVNTALVGSKKRITLADRISGLVNNNIQIKTGELFHFQVPSFTLIADEKMVTSMETTIEQVQEIYTRVFFNSNKESSPKQRSLVRKDKDLWVCLGAAVFGIAVASFQIWTLSRTQKEISSFIFYVLTGASGGLFGTITMLEMEGGLLAGPLCGVGGALWAHHFEASQFD